MSEQEFVFQGFAQSSSIRKGKPQPAVKLTAHRGKDGSTSYGLELASSIWDALDVSGTGRALVAWNGEELIVTSAPPDLPSDAVAPLVNVKKSDESRVTLGLGRIVSRTAQRPKAFPLQGALSWMDGEARRVHNVSLPVTETCTVVGRPLAVVVKFGVKGTIGA